MRQGAAPPAPARCGSRHALAAATLRAALGRVGFSRQPEAAPDFMRDARTHSAREAQRAAARRSTSEATPPVRGGGSGALDVANGSGADAALGRRPPRPSPSTCQPSRVSVM